MSYAVFRKVCWESLNPVHFSLRNKQTKTGLAWRVLAYGQKMCPEAGLVSFVCMQFHASITTRRLGLLNFKNPTLEWHLWIVVVVWPHAFKLA